jgi:thioredoxin-like negative regulator of GroEL
MLTDRVGVILFHVPWCPHCQTFKRETWDALQREYRYESSVLVAEVDCVQDRSLCSSLYIQSYPTIRTFVHQDRIGFDHSGERSQSALEAVIRSTFTHCSYAFIDRCNDTEREWLEEWGELSDSERLERRTHLLQTLSRGEQSYNTTIKSLRAKYRHVESTYQSLRLRVRRLIDMLDGVSSVLQLSHDK